MENNLTTNLNRIDNYSECIICFDKVERNICTSCKLCGISCHNNCWNEWIKKSKKNNCIHCGQKNCIEIKKESWFWNLIFCFFPFLTKKNKSI
jgi:hypothetical protein